MRICLPQFTLRGILGLTLVAALALAWWLPSSKNRIGVSKYRNGVGMPVRYPTRHGAILGTNSDVFPIDIVRIKPGELPIGFELDADEPAIKEFVSKNSEFEWLFSRDGFEEGPYRWWKRTFSRQMCNDVMTNRCFGHIVFFAPLERPESEIHHFFRLSFCSAEIALVNKPSWFFEFSNGMVVTIDAAIAAVLSLAALYLLGIVRFGGRQARVATATNGSVDRTVFEGIVQAADDSRVSGEMM